MGGWVTQRKCVRCMQWLCCVFGIDTGLKFRVVDGSWDLSFLHAFSFFLLTKPSTGPRKRFREMIVAHGGGHG